VGQRFDAAIIIGGLHHGVIDLPGTLRTIRDLLNPGGLLLMMEPSDDFVLAGARRLWYRFDRYFDADTEHALSHREVLKAAGGDFAMRDVKYLGGPGYFFILNSMVFRLPRAVKQVVTGPLLLTDRLYCCLPGAFLFP